MIKLSCCSQIDVESHEGHVIAGSEKLFQEVEIPFVWMEWEHVRRNVEYGAKFIIDFMRKHNMEPFNLMSGERLEEADFKEWPLTVLWKKRSSL